MDTLIPYALLCFTSFFTLTNPLGTMPVFLTMTNGLNDDERKHIIKRATIVSFITLIAFTLCGQFLFKFFGISTNGFRIAAGIIILKIGYDMLQARYSSAKLKEDEIKAYVESQIDKHGFDVILSHTCPLKYEPIEMFLSMIDQSTVDKSTEVWLDSIEERVKYKAWFCGHWHTNKRIDKMHFLYGDFEFSSMLKEQEIIDEKN